MIIRKIETVKEVRKSRVAAYARVSTEFEEQRESFETQVRHYTEFIEQNPDWEFVKVYADPGKSGTSVKSRPGFREMLADAEEHRMDIILVKSISRFARNAADAQRYVHELKANGVEVRFEREALSSFDPSAEMVFNILSAVAQEESRSISENVKWAYRKNAERGIRRLGSNRALGYDVDQDGKLVPNEDAWIARMIFEQYAAGTSVGAIVKALNDSGAKRIRSDKPFKVSSIQRILENEIYVGDRTIQKAPPHNYLTKRPDITEPYVSYYITDDHKAIIARETWECAKARLERTRDERTAGIFKRKTTHFLYGLVFCAKCGSVYKRRTVRGMGGMEKVWKCAEHVKGSKGNGCLNAIIKENALLRLISGELGWEWEGVENFNAEMLMATVQRVDIDEKGVHILKKKAACFP